jgi:acylphosphatase
MLSRHLTITGRVQGVGYRDAMQSEAEALGVRGWVRNRRDGAVEAFLQGPGDAVEALIAWARRGPPLARVAEVRIDPDPPQSAPLAGFERLPSA